MNPAQNHLRRYPHARRSTLDYLEKRAETTERLKKEVAVMRWKKRLSRLFWIWRRV